MKHERTLHTAARICVVVLCALVSVRANAQQKPTHVAVCDVQHVFENLREKVEIEADLQAMAEQFQQEGEQRATKLRDLQHDLELLAKDSDAHSKKVEQIGDAVIELQVYKGIITQRINRERALKTEYLYRKMLKAIGDVAKENAYDLVLFKERKVDFSKVKREALNAAISLRKVLWSSDELDITEQVTTNLNNAFTNPAL